MPKFTFAGVTATFFFAAIATPALAQDPDPQPMMDKAEEAMMDKAEDAVMDMAKDTVTDAEPIMEKAEDTLAEPMTEDVIEEPPMFEPDMDAEPVMKDKAMMETAPSPTVAPPTSIAVACPSGTTAQPDGTCMITGDWEAGE
jgi:hypothetical protein